MTRLTLVAFAALASAAPAADPTLVKLAADIAAEARARVRPRESYRAESRFRVFNRNGRTTQNELCEMIGSPQHGRSIVTSQLPGETVERKWVYGGNPRYVFELGWQAEAWVITSVAAPTPKGTKTGGRDELLSGFHGIGSTYHGVLASPKTVLVRGGPTVWRGRPHRELVIDCDILGNDGGTYRRRYGLYVAPDGPATMAGYRLYLDGDPAGWQTEDVFECEPDAGGRLRPKVHEVWVADRTAGYEPWRAQRWEWLKYERLAAPPADRELTLSAFGLPEPTAVPEAAPPPAVGGGDAGLIRKAPEPPPEPWRPWWLLAVLAAVLVLVGAWAARRRAG